MECVKEKIKDSKVFQAKDARRVYDKVRAEWRHSVSKNNTLDLPTEKEKLSDKVERLFREGTSAGSDIVSPTTALSNKTKALFSEGEVTLLHRLFEDMLQSKLLVILHAGCIQLAYCVYEEVLLYLTTTERSFEEVKSHCRKSN